MTAENTQWAVWHFDDNGARLHLSRPMTEGEARARLAECNDLGGQCRLVLREVSDWSFADGSGVVS